MADYVFVRECRDFYKITAETEEAAKEIVQANQGRMLVFWDRQECGDFVFYGTHDQD
jgi:hypothetical protein